MSRVTIDDAESASRSSFESVEAWAYAYVTATDLEYKCGPPKPPEEFSGWFNGLVPTQPGRPEQLRPQRGKLRSVTAAALTSPQSRARLVHTFWHHELQAAELMCWALLRFVDAELEFRRGLLRICRDELRHMQLYRDHIERLGFRVGDFAVRDWFWERVPSCESKLEFVALMGMGLEAANLEHTSRFAQWFERAGDAQGAELQRRIGREEVAHVRFGTEWFRRWTGDDDFVRWSECLPKPLTPLLMRGKTLDRDARKRASMSERFIDDLAAWQPRERGRS